MDTVAQRLGELKDKENKELFAKVSPIISSSAYSKAVKEIGMKVLSGERPLWALTDRVEEIDEENEKAKSDATKSEQPDATTATNENEKPDEKEKIKAEAIALGMKFGTAKKEN